MKTVIYARYSSERQNEQSIEGQLRECYAYAKAHGLTVVREYIDRAISGKAAENREAFQQMISDSDRKAFDAVLVYRTDRFARNRYDSAIYKSRLTTILHNKKYIGWYICKDISIEGGVPAIIEPELFEAVQRRLSANRKHPQKKRAKEEYLLTGKLYCGGTDVGMVGHSGTSRNGCRYYYYKPVEKGSPQKSLRKDWIEDLVVDETVKNILQPDMIDLIAEHCAAISATESRTDEVDTLRQQLKATEKAIKGLLSAMEQGIVTRSTTAPLTRLNE